MNEENKKEPIFTITREDGSTNEVFESDLDEKNNSIGKRAYKC